VPTKCLLCVDDDDATLQSRKLLLEASGYSVVTSTSAQDALELLAKGPSFDLVLLDYLMPGMNGDQFAAKLRTEYPHLPLMVVSAVGQLPHSLRKTVDVSLQKGQDPEILLSHVAAILARGEHERSPNPVQRTVLCVEDEELQLKSRRMLFEAAGYRVLEADSAKAALELFDSSDVDVVVMDYWLSGPGGNGTAVAEYMKRRRPRIPIVMLSGFSSLPGEGAVVDSWMRKAGLEPELLLREVDRLIELRKLPPESRYSES
jgi:CheY-like chemotaxis protein